MSNKKLFVILILFIFLIVMGMLFLATSLSFLDLNSESEGIKSNIKEKVYIAPYMGDIDGDASEDWFFFYEKVVDFHNKEKIPVTLSFYPVSIRDNKEFNKIFGKMYESEYIDLMQKGYTGEYPETIMDELAFQQQKSIIKNGQDHFKKKIKEILGVKNVKIPVSYNQINGKFNEDTRKAAESLGLKIYFDMYIGDGIDILESTETFDIVQYGLGFPKKGESGRHNVFSTPEEMFQYIEEYNRTDLPMLFINSKKIVPIWLHQQDFEGEKDNTLDKEKWKIYTETLKALREDPNVKLVTARQIYELRRSYVLSL